MTPPRPTKEQLVAALALVLAVGVVRTRVSPPAPGPLPKVPPVEGAVDVPKDEIPVARPRLLKEARASEGRDPFAASDIWADPLPASLPLPPELPEGRLVPVLSIGAGRARAPRPPRIAALPKVVREEPPPPADAPGMGGIR